MLVSDSGPSRNAAAQHIQNFVTRDGTPPDEVRRIGREQLADVVELTNGARVERDVLFTHSPQRQVELMRALGLAAAAINLDLTMELA